MAGYWWLMPVILVTQKAGNRRMWFETRARQIEMLS
jgi:hypothetical protein